MKSLLLLVAALPAFAADHQLKATPATVAWGYYWSAAKPADIQQELKTIYAEVKDKGPGGHILTGPIYVEGAEPGDTLEVRIQKINLAIPYGYNGFAPNRGFLPEDFPRARTKIIRLDEKRMVGHFAKGIEIPLKPFFGSMGVA